MHAPERWSYLVKRINSQLINLPISLWFTENCRCISINYDCSLLICFCFLYFLRYMMYLWPLERWHRTQSNSLLAFIKASEAFSFSPNLFSTIQYVDMILMSIYLIDINKTVFYHQGCFMIILRDCVFFY